jgi:hypothetical protein
MFHAPLAAAITAGLSTGILQATAAGTMKPMPSRDSLGSSPKPLVTLACGRTPRPAVWVNVGRFSFTPVPSPASPLPP